MVKIFQANKSIVSNLGEIITLKYQRLLRDIKNNHWQGNEKALNHLIDSITTLTDELANATAEKKDLTGLISTLKDIDILIEKLPTSKGAQKEIDRIVSSLQKLGQNIANIIQSIESGSSLESQKLLAEAKPHKPKLRGKRMGISLGRRGAGISKGEIAEKPLASTKEQKLKLDVRQALSTFVNEAIAEGISQKALKQIYAYDMDLNTIERDANAIMSIIEEELIRNEVLKEEIKRGEKKVLWPIQTALTRASLDLYRSLEALNP